MKKRLQKLAVATAVTAAMAGMSLPAQAIVTGIAGEALLVPLTIWDDDRGGVADVDLNTLIEIEVPASIGWEAVANTWTASHSTPTFDPLKGVDNFDSDVFKPVVVDGNTRYVAKIHWFLYNKYSEEIANDVIKVTPDDVVQINFRDLMGGDYEGVPTYMVFVNDASYGNPAQGAKFSMFGDAWLVNGPVGTMQVEIPVLPMNDGPDTTDYPVYADNVVYPGGGAPDVSPFASGNLMNFANGIFGGVTVFDVPLSTPNAPTYHVLWRDISWWTPDMDWNPNATTTVNLEIYDSEEKACSDTIDLENELDIICWDPAATWESTNCGWDTGLLPATNVQTSTCKTNEADANGFVSYRFPEWIDRGSASPETAGFMFAIMNRTIGVGTDNDIAQEMALGRFRGWYPAN
jgi:hypothetical protein